MSGLHYEGGGTCRVCGRRTDDLGTCACIREKSLARPSLEAPPTGTRCPQCLAVLELEDYCGACGWEEKEW